jgi:outer membrane protein TolC
VQKIVGLAIASADSKDAQHQRQLGEAMETLKALAGRAVTVNSPVTVNPSIDVKAATAPNVEFIVAEGAIQNHSDLNVAAGAIQAHTNLSQPGNEDVQIEYDNYGATGKPVRLTRRRH